MITRTHCYVVANAEHEADKDGLSLNLNVQAETMLTLHVLVETRTRERVLVVLARISAVEKPFERKRGRKEQLASANSRFFRAGKVWHC